MALPELILVDKPKGMSSFTVVRILRRRTGIRKFGYAGTLDPLATGLMLVGVEKGTKRLSSLIGLDKEYVAEILLGEQRSTGDEEGVILAERAYTGDCSAERLRETLDSLIGEHELPVSAYSAIKVEGVRMYKRARKAEKKGEVITDLPIRRMVVYEAELLKVGDVTTSPARLPVTVRFRVSSGTYIRSLAEEFGRRLGYPARLSALRRTKIGSYSITEASQLEDFGGGVRTSLGRLLSRLCRLFELN